MGKEAYLETPIDPQELACIYSALILADDDIPITAEKLTTLIKAADVEVEPIWPSLFARALAGSNVRELLVQAVMSGAGGASSAATTATGAATSQAEEEAKPDKPAEPEEDDSDEDFGLSLFD